VGDVADKWGVAIEGILIKDIIFSPEVSASLSSAAQQKRIGESKVIAARAEVDSARLMRQAADILASPAAMQIRQLEACAYTPPLPGYNLLSLTIPLSPSSATNGQVCAEQGHLRAYAAPERRCRPDGESLRHPGRGWHSRRQRIRDWALQHWTRCGAEQHVRSLITVTRGKHLASFKGTPTPPRNFDHPIHTKTASFPSIILFLCITRTHSLESMLILLPIHKPSTNSRSLFQCPFILDVAVSTNVYPSRCSPTGTGC